MNKGLSDYKIKKIMDCFGVDITASKTALLLGVSRNNMNRYYSLFQQKIVASLAGVSGLCADEIASDASYCSPKRIRGKKGRGVSGKPHVFGLLKRVARYR